MGKSSSTKEKSNAINMEMLLGFVKECDLRQISKYWQEIRNLLSSWVGIIDNQQLSKFFIDYPYLQRFLDFGVISSRINEKKTTDIKLVLDNLMSVTDIIPELIIVDKTLLKRFVEYPKTLEKAESWLYYSAVNEIPDSSFEALVYFASKGQKLLENDHIKEILRLRLNRIIMNDILLSSRNKNTIKRATEGKLLLSEIIDIMTEQNYFPRILMNYDNEDDFIDITFFRVVEWFQLKGFEPFIDHYSREISTSYQGGFDSYSSIFYIFYVCRSDLALRKVSRLGIEAYLYGLAFGSIDANKPWKKRIDLKNEFGRESVTVDHILVASIILFAWVRINPSNLNTEIYQNALDLLFRSQLIDGSWPYKSSDFDGDILTTCIAITAISIIKPTNWQMNMDKARNWLMNQMNEVGCWLIGGAPTIMVNILCLEAISLSEGSSSISYSIPFVPFNPTSIPDSPNQLLADGVVIFCEGETTSKKNKQFDANCFQRIFSLTSANAIFYSVGNCDDVLFDNKGIIEAVESILPSSKIIRLIDRDNRSDEEVRELKKKGIRVLSKRHIESYLLDDEIIIKLCRLSQQEEAISDVLKEKNLSIEKSIKRGNPLDDVKSASGDIFNSIKRILGLTKCGNDTASFLKITMAPLITPDTSIYKLLKLEIFET